MKRVTLTKLSTFGCALIMVQSVTASDFTLSDSAILSLDYNVMTNYYSPPLTATIVSKQDIAGPGVQFNIHFNDTNWVDCEIFNVSSSKYGAGTAAGIDVSAYSNFSLAFTLLSVDGSTSGNEDLIVGSLLGPRNGGYIWAYRPKYVSLTGFNPPSAVSTISVESASIGIIGFTAYLSPENWSAGPHDVTLLVAPAPGAVQIPEPSTWSLLALAGVAFLVGHRLRHRFL